MGHPSECLPLVSCCLVHELACINFKCSLHQGYDSSNTEMQADQITSFVFSKLIRQARGKELLDLLNFLEAQVYSKLEAAYEPTIRKLQVGYAMQ